MRYARVLQAVEINSSFYRPHRRQTYERWAASTPEHFLFSVKVPREITHLRRLVDCEAPLARFLDEARGLGSRLGPLLVQLPPSLRFDFTVADRFLALLRQQHAGPVALEPRHPTWFTDEANALLEGKAISRVAADPAPVPKAASPEGDPRLVYLRLHGSPVMYRSRYDSHRLNRIARAMAEATSRGATAWCIFDNTAEGHAMPNALELMEIQRQRQAERAA